MYYFKLYFLTLLAFFAIDMLWLGLVARNFYQKYLGHLMRSPVNWPAAILFYLLFIGGIIFFAVRPALAETSIVKAIFYGVLFGLMTYATYDLTNLATLKDWPLTVTLVDLLWGMVLSGSVSAIGYLAGQWLV